MKAIKGYFSALATSLSRSAFGILLLIVIVLSVPLTVAALIWHFDRHAAKPAGSFAKMTIMEFDEYRRNVMPQGLARACKEAQGKYLGTGDELPIRASNYCDCYGQVSADTLTQEDLVYHETHGAYNEDATTRMKDALHSRCGT
jgi:hypothetical protein